MKFQKSVTYLWLILVILNQFKGDYSCISEASLTKLYMHHSIMIYTSCKFHEMLFIGYLVMALDQPENYINPSLKGDNKIDLRVKDTNKIFGRNVDLLTRIYDPPSQSVSSHFKFGIHPFLLTCLQPFL